MLQDKGLRRSMIVKRCNTQEEMSYYCEAVRPRYSDNCDSSSTRSSRKRVYIRAVTAQILESTTAQLQP